MNELQIFEKAEQKQKEIEEIKLKANNLVEKVITRKNENREHQAKVHNQILKDLQTYINDVETRKELIKEIAKGKIKNLNIIY